jgi:hypothetical protein
MQICCRGANLLQGGKGPLGLLLPSPPPPSAKPLSSHRQQWSAHRPLSPHRSFATKPPGQLCPTHTGPELSWRPPPVHTHSTQHERSARTHAAALQIHTRQTERTHCASCGSVLSVGCALSCISMGPTAAALLSIAFLSNKKGTHEKQWGRGLCPGARRLASPCEPKHLSRAGACFGNHIAQ